MIPNNFD